MKTRMDIDRASSELQRLLSYQNSDPDNLALRSQIISTAMDEGLIELAADQFDTLPAGVNMPAEMQNIRAIVALRQHDFAAASDAFEALIASGHNAPSIRFNLAWTKAMLNDFSATLALLDDAALATSPRAPTLRIHAMHHLEMYEEALTEGSRIAALYPTDQELTAALATLAMDMGQRDLARAYADVSADYPEALTVHALFALEDNDTARSLSLFEHAIKQQPNNPRAWVGKGLSLIARGNIDQGADALTKGANLFGSHLGSWIAAGWAEFLRDNETAARIHFEMAISLDGSFAEGHGGLAAIEAISGSTTRAEHYCEVALRLDRQCFGAALAKTLLLSRIGDEESAQKVRARALAMPIGRDGETLAELLPRLAHLRAPSTN